MAPASALASEPSNYAALGGADGVAQIVSALLDRSTSDPQTRRTFAKINRPQLEKRLGQQICQLSGGGCVYEGESMLLSHGGMKITESEFYGMVEHLREVLDARSVPLATKNALLAQLAPMKRDIVGH
ncbi:group 1 truncated hemoglobin [Niveibacterium sp. 24ML]|uniref:group I truncated hemoglobin n=1 Tax=Niveibacterium sp. 24ML TaxID=2985512 RepID=UPI00226E8AC6|nr:group 1 truncated hemoglobin [Niveibacterium sp. 24ML]MCX9155042.1 group 1 truncated hemoglobin [Niveibacterium sp. 24ML]